MSALLEVTSLAKAFPAGPRTWTGRRRRSMRAVDDVSFAIDAGDALGLVGESGCGKSTVARLLVGLERPDAGSIRLEGHELARLSPRRRKPFRRRIQMIYQDPYGSLDPRQTLGAILTEPLKIQRLGKPRERLHRAIGLLEAVGLAHRHLNRYPHEFSGGQRQRIVIARALALEPEVLVCDEPVSSLDVSVRAQIVNLLKELRQRFGLAYLLISHDLGVVRELSERISVMYLGRIVEEAPRDELFAAPRHPYTRALLSSIPIPDPTHERRRERIVLAGDVPSPFDPPSGCSFHTRCPERSRVPEHRCSREVPELLGDGARRVACHLEPRTTTPAPPESESEPESDATPADPA